MSATDETYGLGAKRQKLRKGTTSCWACKRRKEKCDRPQNGVCSRCRLRGTECVSQQFDEESLPTEDSTRRLKRRLARVEELLDTCMTKLNDHTQLSVPEQAEFDVSIADRDAEERPSVQPPSPGPSASAAFDQHSSINKRLYECLPTRNDLEIICRPNTPVIGALDEFLTLSYSTMLKLGCRSPEDLLDVPSVDSHPVILARYCLHIASVVQHCDTDVFRESRVLSEDPKVIMDRLANTAISLVTSQDSLLGSLEGVEVCMIESTYQAKRGNLRLSWLACRRAMLLAQVLGLDSKQSDHGKYRRLDPGCQSDPQHMWFRLVYYDRQLCITLGLQPGSTDCSMASAAPLQSETHLGKLERMHCVISYHILQSKALEGQGLNGPADSTHQLDRQLQEAAKSLPSQWWLPPTLDTEDPAALFMDVRTLVVQMNHYSLVNQLHIHSMLSRSVDIHAGEQARDICMNAAREMLSRFSILRRFNKNAYSCRIADFLALMAAITLILGHLNNHWHGDSHALTCHHYASDRAMLEQALQNFQKVSRMGADALSAQSADLLRHLLVLEADAASHPNSAVSVEIEDGDAHTRPCEANGNYTRVHVPYFGVIKVARNYPNNPAGEVVHRNDLNFDHPDSRYHMHSTDTTYRRQSADDAALIPDHMHPELWSSAFTGSSDSGHEGRKFFNALLPLPVAGAGDWAFHGIDINYEATFAPGILYRT